MTPVTVEVIAYAPTGFYHCTHCEVVWHEVGLGQPVHREQLETGIPEDLRQDYLRLSAWARALVDRYGDRVAVSVVDAASVEGFFKALWHRARRFPSIVVDGRSCVQDGDYARADALVAECLDRRAEAAMRGGGA